MELVCLWGTGINQLLFANIFSRNFFMTQFAENDDLAKNTLLEIDLLDLKNTKPVQMLAISGTCC